MKTPSGFSINRYHFHKFQEGNDHNVFLLENGREKFVLKQYRFRTADSVEKEARFIDFLAKSGRRVPRVFAVSEEKHGLVFEWRGQPAILMEHLPGSSLSHIKPSLKLLQEIGRELGQIDYSSYQTNRRPIHKKTELLNDILTFHPLFKHSAFGYFLKSFPGLDHLYDSIAIQYCSNRRIIKKLPRALMHNDVVEKNILVYQNRFRGLIDFSDAILSTPIVNISIAAANICFNQARWQEGLPEFLNAYRAKFPFLYWRETKNLFPFLMECRILSEMATNFYLGTVLGKARNTMFTNRRLWRKLLALRLIGPRRISAVLRECR